MPNRHLTESSSPMGQLPEFLGGKLALRRRAGSQGLRNTQPREAYKYRAV